MINSTNQQTSYRVPKNSKKMFTIYEDALLIKCVTIYGENNWKSILKYFPERSIRQIRDRYNSYLKPGNVDAPWTHEEDILLSQKIEEYGKHWSVIAKFFKGRNQNNIKNRWNFHLKGGKNLKIENIQCFNNNKISNNDNNIKNPINISNYNNFQYNIMNQNNNPMKFLNNSNLKYNNSKKNTMIKSENNNEVKFDNLFNQGMKTNQNNCNLFQNSEKTLKSAFYILPSIKKNQHENDTKATKINSHLQSIGINKPIQDEEFDLFWNSSISDSFQFN